MKPSRPLCAGLLLALAVGCAPASDSPELPTSFFEQVTATVDVGGTPIEVTGAKVEVRFFEIMGIAPLLGRLFVDAEYAGDGVATVIVSEQFWRESMGAGPDAIGTTLNVDGAPRVVVGVLPEGFDAPEDAVFWIAGPPPAFVFRDVRVFDGEAVIPVATVVIEGGLITQVAAAGEAVQTPAGAQIIDGSGKTLLPGLIDAHTHNHMRGHLKGAVAFGTTTHLDMFTDPELAQAMRDEQAAGRASDRADLYSAGILVTAPEGHGTQYGVPIPTLSAPSEAEAFVAARLGEGSDYIKIVYDDLEGFGSPLPTLDEATLRATIAAAHAADKMAVVHVTNEAFARRAIVAGADGLVHIFADQLPEPDFGSFAAEHDVFVVPTLAVMEGAGGGRGGASLVDDPNLNPLLLEGAIANLQVEFTLPDSATIALDNGVAAVSLLHEAGVTLLAGTDAPNPGTYHGVSMHRELELLVRAGLTPLEALVAATSAPADAFGLDDRGRIAPGKRADLWIVNGDPTTDILATRAIDNIWKEGRRYKLELLRDQVAMLPASG